MKTKDRDKLQKRVEATAEAALTRQGYVCALDVFSGIGWLDPTALARWRQGRLPALQSDLQTNLERITDAIGILVAWAKARELEPTEVAYVSKTPARTPLRFVEVGDDATDHIFRIHWMSPDLSAKKREHLEEAANRPPELVVVQPLDDDWKCHKCGGTGDFLLKEAAGPACLDCAGLGALVFLQAGDAQLSRRAKAKSEVHAVVVRFSRSRKRFERQGLLVHPDALRAAEASREVDAPPKRRSGGPRS